MRNRKKYSNSEEEMLKLKGDDAKKNSNQMKLRIKVNHINMVKELAKLI